MYHPVLGTQIKNKVFYFFSLWKQTKRKYMLISQEMTF